MKISKALPVAAVTLALTWPVAGVTEAHAAASVTRQVCGSPTVNVRSGPGTGYAKLGTVKRGEIVRGPRSGGWIRIGSRHWMSYGYTCPPKANAASSPPKAAPVYRAPAARIFLQPTGTNGSPTSPFGMRRHPITKKMQLHNGIDLGDTAGRPVYAAAAGTVALSRWTSGGGLTVRLSHGRVGAVSAVSTYYLHLSRSLVREGVAVRRGQLVGYVGSTGSVTKPHLHFSVSENGAFVDPVRYIGPLASLRR